MYKRFFVTAVCLTVVLVSVGGASASPTSYHTVDFQKKTGKQFKITSGIGATDNFHFTFLENGSDYDATGNTVELRIAKNRNAATNGMVTFIGVVSTNTATFTATTNNTFGASYDSGYAVIVMRDTAEQSSFAFGTATILKTPEIVSPALVYYTNTNAPPFVRYTDEEAVDAVTAAGFLTNGVDVAANNTFTGTNTFTKTILGTTTNATALNGNTNTPLYAEVDPIWGAVSNTVTAGAALGATAVQPTDAAYTNTAALAAGAFPSTGGTISGDVTITNAAGLSQLIVGDITNTNSYGVISIEAVGSGGPHGVADVSGDLALVSSSDVITFVGDRLTDLADGIADSDAATVGQLGGGGGGSGFPRVMYSPDSLDRITATLSVELYTNALGVSHPFIPTDSTTVEWFGDNAGFILPTVSTQAVFTVVGRGASAAVSTNVLRYSVNRATSWTTLTNVFTSTTSTADYIFTNGVTFAIGDIVVWQMDTTTATGDFQHEGVLFELR